MEVIQQLTVHLLPASIVRLHLILFQQEYIISVFLMETTVPNLAPVITCPGNVSISNAPGICGAPYVYEVLAEDACPGIGSITQTAGLPSGATFPVGTTVNTFIVEDDLGVS